MAHLIVFDMEWNMGYQPKTFQYQGVEQNLRGEILQIGAVRLEKGQLGERFTVTIRPRIFPRLHHHVAKVTGLTQAQVNAGVSLKEGLEQFIAWCGPNAVLGEWGLDDVPVLKQNLVLAGLNESWPTAWCDLQRVYCAQRPRAEGEGMTLESVVERLGIEKDEAFHDALSDAVYTARVCQGLDMEQGLAAYPNEIEQLQELLCPPDKERHGFVAWPGRVEGESWLSDKALRTAACPVCGETLVPDEQDMWLRRGNNCLYTMQRCKAHGPVMVYLRRSRQDGLHFTFARAVEAADSPTATKWDKEKKAALGRLRRKKEMEAAEALEKIKNAGR